MQVGASPVVVGGNAFGIEANGLVGVSDGPVVLQFSGVTEPSIAVGVDIARVEADGLAVVADSPVALSLQVVNPASGEENLKSLGVEADGLVEVSEGLVVLLPPGVGDPSVVVSGLIPRMLPDVGAEAGDGQVVLPLLQGCFTPLDVACTERGGQEEDRAGQAEVGHGRTPLRREESHALRRRVRLAAATIPRRGKRMEEHFASTADGSRPFPSRPVLANVTSEQKIVTRGRIHHVAAARLRP